MSNYNDGFGGWKTQAQLNLALEKMVAKERDKFAHELHEAKEELAQLRAAEAATCLWREDSDGVWDTACGASIVFEDGTPENNNSVHCQVCGKTALFVHYVEMVEVEKE